MGILVNQYQYQVSQATMTLNIVRQLQSTTISTTIKPEQILNEFQKLTTRNGQISTMWTVMALWRLALEPVLGTCLQIGVPQELKMMHSGTQAVAGRLVLVSQTAVMPPHHQEVTRLVPDLWQKTCKV